MVVLPLPAIIPAGEVIALDISPEKYMEQYAADYHEWVRGYVLKMSPVSLIHHNLLMYLSRLLDTYLELNPVGKTVGQPFVMVLEEIPSRREPDLQVILNTNPGTLTHTAMLGPADICIEIVSPESFVRDHGEKLKEYEQGGVQEYWIIDPEHRECRFYQRNETGLYEAQSAETNYRTPLLPKFYLNIATFWLDELPKPLAIAEMVKAMLAEE